MESLMKVTATYKRKGEAYMSGVFEWQLHLLHNAWTKLRMAMHPSVKRVDRDAYIWRAVNLVHRMANVMDRDHVCLNMVGDYKRLSMNPKGPPKPAPAKPKFAKPKGTSKAGPPPLSAEAAPLVLAIPSPPPAKLGTSLSKNCAPHTAAKGASPLASVPGKKGKAPFKYASPDAKTPPAAKAPGKASPKALSPEWDSDMLLSDLFS
jgi:hypothetical protein